jgi:hypothetical protein
LTVTHVHVDAEPPAHPDPGPVPPVYAQPVYAQPVYAQKEPNAFNRLVVRTYERMPRWAAPAAIAVCFGGAAGYVLVSNPTDAGAGDLPSCLIKLTTGLDCPGCGGTRAFYFLMQGNVPEAARHHVMAVFAAPFLVWLYVAWAIKHVTGKSIAAPKITAKAMSLYLAAWGVFMVVRNIPIAPFTSFFV